MYVLDTNTLIYFFKGMGRVPENLLAKSPHEIGIPAIVLYELEYGILKSASPKKRIEQLHALCALITVLPFSQREAKIAAAIRFDLEQKGQPIGHYDILIAATALQQNAVLVTNNTREFSRIEILKIEDWY
ncbi:type II toxin-antitoxin system VapC family toxin [Nitrosomonas sp.]|uniref:type II toxin-antitoxin system VapC family toxin n=1 Tax=Nitrosomonas sp. TaxID=42353 RepID=UPI001DF4DA1B|nr:type II toxin-antitoxin system VapC family toxin [Nitrosomonas sp.]MCB1949913.1 type II toxin-antitoxin system VapC family toxin [Nitrosomonas sp.]